MADTTTTMALVDGIKLAMHAEREAANFYAEAAKRCVDRRGKDMFNQLVSFEQHHFQALEKLLAQMVEGTNVAVDYQGTKFDIHPPELPLTTLNPDARSNDIDAITLAIEAEKRAFGVYTDLALVAPNPAVSELFNKMAAEEDLHRKVLEDQFLALSNKGYWTWGE